MNEYQFAPDRLTRFMYYVYGFMACALAVTALTGYFVASNPALYTPILTNSALLIGICIVQLGLVMALNFCFLRISYVTAVLLFFMYALSVGVTLSMIFLLYTMHSVAITFAICSLTFAAMTVYGYITQSDLTKIGNLCFMLLVGIVIALFANMFANSEVLDLIVSVIGVIVFTALVAVDTQKIKRLGSQVLENQELLHKMAVLGALALYLDFLNVFLFLLRFTGRRNES